MLRLSVLILFGWVSFALSYKLNNGLSLMNEGRIVGGFRGNIEDFPYQVSMNHYGSHRCGASIIHKQYVLTAAHCTTGVIINALSIRAGSSLRSMGGINVSVGRVVPHPRYNSNTLDFDIAIMYLSWSLSFTNSMYPVNLPRQGEVIPVGTNTLISGWGELSETGGSTQQLQYVQVPIIDDHTCQEAYGRYNTITPNMICAGLHRKGGKDACQGDSGGPMVAHGKLFGIISWGFGCARPNFPGVYTKVSAFRNWIDSIIQ
ncbi:Trypsin-7 [Pseudolycoriella hygida]|uniref:trypsin n=1 Tax=Pseudolycoriella hygida TaxID=35572 RepID=A0A9Q0RV20_9DIPT|nr:Trypsin-7 [Pseudolycoriella hygida]